MNIPLPPVARCLCTVTVALLIAAQATTARADVEKAMGPKGERMTQIRSSGQGTFANLFDPATQSSGFLSVMRDAVAGTTALDFAWATPFPADPRYVVLIQGAGMIPDGAFVVGRNGARLNVSTPFETLRCVVDTELGHLECASGPAQAFELAWTRNGVESEWLQELREYRLGPLVLRSRGEFEQRAASVTGRFGGLPLDGALGSLIDTTGTMVQRGLSIKVAP
jgi:hypothetical protein